MSPIRVHLGPMPEMLLAIVGDLLREEPDFVLVGRSGAGQDALRNARDEGADVLITHDGGDRAGTCLDAILSAAPIGIFAISGDGRNAAGVKVLRNSIALDRESGSALAPAIRTMAEQLQTPSAGGDRQRPA